MAMINCPECGEKISDKAFSCPKCGNPIRPLPTNVLWRGYEWKTKTKLFGLPLIHIAIGRDKQTGKLLTAKGIIAIGQFGIGLITIAQFGIGLLFGLGQFTAGFISISQFALAYYFGLGQFATGITAIGQLALGVYVRAQLGFGEHVWSSQTQDPVAIEYFNRMMSSLFGAK